MDMKRLSSGTIVEIFGTDFELIDTGFSTGEYNMRFDVERAESIAGGNASSMFRTYGWKPFAVSLGANQKESDVSRKKCEEFGFDVVRRPTGGRAVLHADEITYSCVMKLPRGMNVHDAYRDIHILLLKGIKALGCADLDFEKTSTDFREFYKRDAMSAACFAGVARYEICSGIRKAVGSAQRLLGDVLLQHGSILLGSGYERLADVVNMRDESDRARLAEYTRTHSITLSESAGKRIDYDHARDAIFNALI